jgi:hypothetical protein
MLQVTADGGIAGVVAASAHPEVELAKVKVNITKDTSIIAEVLKKPFVQGWEEFTNCVTTCDEGGGEALVCAHQCYDDLAPIYQDLPPVEEILGTDPPPTPAPTPPPPSTTPGPEICNGNEDCLWLKCCHGYTAICLSCVMDAPPAELCMMSQYLSVPGCGQALLGALQEERSQRKQKQAL